MDRVVGNVGNAESFFLLPVKDLEVRMKGEEAIFDGSLGTIEPRGFRQGEVCFRDEKKTREQH